MKEDDNRKASMAVNNKTWPSVLITETKEIKGLGKEDAKSIDHVEFRKTHICRGCNVLITDEYIFRLTPNSEWHAHCLQCEYCKLYLGNMTTCYLKNEKPYCRRDYHRLFSRSCAGCNIKLYEDDLVMKVKTFLFHVECFRCLVCHDVVMSGEPFRMDKSGILCKRHYAETIYRTRSTEDFGYNTEKNHREMCRSRVRTVLTDQQIDVLQACYSSNPKPDALLKKQLVEITGLSLRVIRVWFQNKRCKEKKKSVATTQDVEVDGPSNCNISDP